MEEETGKIPPRMDGGRCPTGKVLRVGYTATRRAKGLFGKLRGKRYTVKASCIKNTGKPGKGPKVIGPLKEGELTAMGYSAQSPAGVRHAALDRAVSHYGKLSALHKVNAIAVLTKRTAPSRSRTYTTDVHYIQKKYF
jgi:hypothetical protein